MPAIREPGVRCTSSTVVATIAALWLLVLAFATRIFPPGTSDGRSPASIQSGTTALKPRIPVYFEKNQGQVDASVRYLSRAGRTSLFLTDDAAIFQLVGGKVRNGPVPPGLPATPHPSELTEAAVQIRLMGAKSHPEIAGLEPLAGRVNYLIGNDSRKWHRDIPTFRRIRYRDVYPGVDLTYYGTDDGL